MWRLDTHPTTWTPKRECTTLRWASKRMNRCRPLFGSVQGSRGTCSRPWTQDLGQPLDPGPRVWASLKTLDP
eukprot:5757117-Prymnesium_polylepis.1